MDKVNTKQITIRFEYNGKCNKSSICSGVCVKDPKGDKNFPQKQVKTISNHAVPIAIGSCILLGAIISMGISKILDTCGRQITL